MLQSGLQLVHLILYPCTAAAAPLHKYHHSAVPGCLVCCVQFQRSYRACVRAHKLALQAQRQFWHSMLRDNVSFKELQLCFEGMEKTEKQATAVYRR